MRTFSAVVYKEDKRYVAHCPETGTARQGESIEEAVQNLREATELYLEEFPVEATSFRPIMTTSEAPPHACSKKEKGLGSYIQQKFTEAGGAELTPHRSTYRNLYFS